MKKPSDHAHTMQTRLLNTANPCRLLHRFALCLAGAWLLCNTAMAGEADFSADLNAGGALNGVWPTNCSDAGTALTQIAASFSVTQNGDYFIADAGELLATDLLIALYPAGDYRAAQPASGRIALLDGGGLVALQNGTDYDLVVQAQCQPGSGVWAVAVSGPGEIQSSELVPVRPWAAGEVRPGAPTADFGRGATPFADAGLFSVGVTGLHALADVSVLASLDALVHFYDGSFNAANPALNQVATVDDAGHVWLESGRNYRLVVSGFHPGDSGDYRLVLFPPGGMAINTSLSGGWFEPATSGQGILVDVLPDIGLVFMAWFTFDSQPPFDPNEAVIGDSSQRWLTASGGFEEGSAAVELTISNTRAGRFDQAAAGQNQDNDFGSATLTFESCTAATLEYSLPDSGLSGVIPLRRVANDNAPACGEQLPGPGSLVE